MPELTDKNDHKLDAGLKFESFLIAFTESASRARKIINVLTITSIAAFLGLLNSWSKSGNWFPSRQERMGEMYQVVRFEDDTAKENTIKYRVIYWTRFAIKVSIFEHINDFEYGEYKALLTHISGSVIIHPSKTEIIPHPWIHFKLPDFVLIKDPSSKTINVDPRKIIEYRDQIEHGYQMACITSISTKDEYHRNTQALSRAKLENSIFVKVPILGIAFDVNWLIIVSGIGFMALYFLLYYSLSRERKNIVLLFQIAIYEKISVARLYQFMSMQQVFTIPQSIDEYLDEDKENDNKKEGLGNKVKRVIPKLFWAVFPLGIWGWIFTYDIHSRIIGDIINSRLAEIQYRVSWIIAGVLLLLGILCIQESSKIDKEWRRRSKYIKLNEKRNRKGKFEENVNVSGKD